MLRAILADQNDDVRAELEGLINWREEGIDLIAVVSDGDELVEQIKSLHPDLVILDSDIRGYQLYQGIRIQPDDTKKSEKSNGDFYTGLDIAEHYLPFRQFVRFLFVSSHTDYSVMKRALRCEAIDVLKKPVQREELESALHTVHQFFGSRAQMEAELENMDEFRTEQYQTGMLSIPDTNDDYSERILSTCNIDFENEFAVAIFAGLCPEISEELSNNNYQKFTILIRAVYGRILTFFRDNGIGFEIRRTAHRIRMLGIFKLEEKEFWLQKYLMPLIDDLERSYEIRLCMGVGSPANSREQLFTSYQNAKYCHELYFFDQKSLIVWEEQKKRKKRTSLEDYEKMQEEVFRAILTKDPDTLKIIGRSIDQIRQIHYGNWQAVIMRAMNYTGEISTRLRRYRLLPGDFYEMQDDLQSRLLQALIFPEVKQNLMDYFEKLLPNVYQNNRHGSKAAVEQVKTYMKENFMREISVKELSEIACVSPNYFSHMFKNETGENYKSYLTNIRLEHAVLLLLNSEYGLEEICDRTGYQNTRTLVEAFKQKYGLSPTKYKKKMMSD